MLKNIYKLEVTEEEIKEAKKGTRQEHRIFIIIAHKPAFH
jgi:hypothetical protein